MSEKVYCDNLIEFIELCDQSNINFAKITYECGSMEFVDERARYENDRMVKTHKFKELYLDPDFMKFMKYEVMAILYRSYLMYEVMDDAITIWVCYTEEEHQRSGYMTKLLKLLVEKHKNKTITIDTISESLRNICSSLGIVSKIWQPVLLARQSADAAGLTRTYGRQSAQQEL